jgi:hypothetical protein
VLVGKIYPLSGTLRDPTKIGVTIWARHRIVKDPANVGFTLDGNEAPGYEMTSTWQF